MRELRGLRYRPVVEDNPDLIEAIRDKLPFASLDEANAFYKDFADQRLPIRDYAFLGCNDRFFLLSCLCHRRDLNHPWLYDRCREVEADPDGHLDLWARFHYKSTIITFGGVIQEIVCDPETTIAIFSVTKPIAQEFLAQIKEEFESNATLKRLYWDVLWREPRRKDSEEGRPAKWGVARGITVKRTSNPKEATVEAHGLIDAQPTSRHFNRHVYDDIVTQDYLTPEMLKKVTERFQLADNLGSHDGVKKQIVGTRYHFADTYGWIADHKILKPRIYTATEDGSLTGKPVFLTEKRWEEIKQTQLATVSAQMLLNPLSGNEQIFHIDWLRPYEIRPRTLNVYIMGDPSLGRHASSDRTAISVIGVDGRNNKYLLDGVCHRMPLSERWRWLRDFYEKWFNMNGVQSVTVGWERYGAQSDVEYFKERQREEGVDRFDIQELNWSREVANQSKETRIRRLEPEFRLSRFYLPAVVYHPEFGGKDNTALWHIGEDATGVKKVLFTPMKQPTRQMRAMIKTGQDYRCAEVLRRVEQIGEGADRTRTIYDVTRNLIEELLLVPFSPKDDFCDATSRYFDLKPLKPDVHEASALEATSYADS